MTHFVRSLPLVLPLLVLVNAAAARGDDQIVHFNKGVSLQAQKKNKEAIAEFEQVVAANPKHVEAHAALASLYRADGDMAKAATEYGAAATLQPKERAYQVNYGSANLQLKNYDEAIKGFEGAVAIKPDDFESLKALGFLYTEKDNAPKAIEVLNKVVALKPTDAKAWSALGAAKVKTKDDAGAAVAYKKASELDPKNGGYLFNLGAAYGKTNHPDEGLAAYQAAVAADPTLTAAYVNSGMLYVAKKDNEAALRSFKKYVEVAPDGDPELRKVATKNITILEKNIKVLAGQKKAAKAATGK